MKFGDTLERRSPQEYAIRLLIPGHCPTSSNRVLDNIDYNELKSLIKLHTSTDSTRPRPIPANGNVEKERQEFEDQLFLVLQDQHGRVNDFIRMKSGELERRLSMLK